MEPEQCKEKYKIEQKRGGEKNFSAKIAGWGPPS